jgi:hypothetical protein
MKEIMETEKLEERKCLVAQVKPSWVRTLGPGGRFSFAKSPGQKSIRRPWSEEPADTRQGEENLTASESTADAIPELPETHREEPEEENAERRPARSSDHSFQFAKNPGTETKYIMDEDWGDAYKASDSWSEWWDHTQDPNAESWPDGVKIFEKKMYWNEKLCVPENFTGRVIRAHHAEIGHIGGRRLQQEMERWYVFAPGSRAIELAKKIPGQCETCQAHNPSNNPIKGPIEPMVVPGTLGESVCIDIFEMPLVTWGGIF